MWGTGFVRREFLFVDDLAQALFFLMQHYDENQWINVGTGVDISIDEIANMIKEVVGYEGHLVFDVSKPDGTPRKVLNVDRLHEHGWRHSTSLNDGLRKTYEWFINNQGHIRREQIFREGRG